MEQLGIKSDKGHKGPCPVPPSPSWAALQDAVTPTAKHQLLSKLQMHVLGLSNATGGIFSPDTSPHMQREMYTRVLTVTLFVTTGDDTTCSLHWWCHDMWAVGTCQPLGTGWGRATTASPFNIFLSFWNQVNIFKTFNASRWGERKRNLTDL